MFSVASLLNSKNNTGKNVLLGCKKVLDFLKFSFYLSQENFVDQKRKPLMSNVLKKAKQHQLTYVQKYVQTIELEIAKTIF